MGTHSEGGGLTACLRLPLSVDDPVFTLYLTPLNITGWFESHSSKQNGSFTVNRHSPGSITRYTWPSPLLFSHFNTTNKYCTSTPYSEANNMRGHLFPCLCSKVPWGINPQGMNWARPDRSLTRNPHILTPPWYLSLPPCAICPPKSPAIKPIVVLSPLFKPLPLLTWNSSLAVNVSNNQTWALLYFPLLHAALISSACHNKTLDVNMTQRPYQANHFSGNCAHWNAVGLLQQTHVHCPSRYTVRSAVFFNHCCSLPTFVCKYG